MDTLPGKLRYLQSQLCSLIDSFLVAFCFGYGIYSSVIEICFVCLRILRISRSFMYADQGALSSHIHFLQIFQHLKKLENSLFVAMILINQVFAMIWNKPGCFIGLCELILVFRCQLPWQHCLSHCLRVNNGGAQCLLVVFVWCLLFWFEVV